MRTNPHHIYGEVNNKVTKKPVILLSGELTTGSGLQGLQAITFFCYMKGHDAKRLNSWLWKWNFAHSGWEEKITDNIFRTFKNDGSPPNKKGSDIFPLDKNLTKEDYQVKDNKKVNKSEESVTGSIPPL